MQQFDFPVEIAVLSDLRAPELITLKVKLGDTVFDAIRQLGLNVESYILAKAGRVVECDALLASGDRIELLKPLIVTPEEARKLRLTAKKKI